MSLHPLEIDEEQDSDEHGDRPARAPIHTTTRFRTTIRGVQVADLMMFTATGLRRAQARTFTGPRGPLVGMAGAHRHHPSGDGGVWLRCLLRGVVPAPPIHGEQQRLAREGRGADACRPGHRGGRLGPGGDLVLAVPPSVGCRTGAALGDDRADQERGTVTRGQAVFPGTSSAEL
jgi:hypothetical protein